MTAKDHVLAVYPEAIAIRGERISRDAKPDEFHVSIYTSSQGDFISGTSTTFAPSELVFDMAWEAAWQKIQQQMLEKLEEDPEDRRQEDEWRYEELERQRYAEEQREWEEQMAEYEREQMEKQLSERHRIRY